MKTKKFYLGDSVYAHYDGYHWILVTDYGLGPTDEIALDPDVFQALMELEKRRQMGMVEIPKTK